MYVYLASPIDHHKDSLLYQARDDMRQILIKSETVLFDPAKAWSIDVLTKTNLDELDRLSQVNFAALNSADLLVAMVPLKVPTVGTPIEVYHTLTQTDIPVALWFGTSISSAIGAMWAHLLNEYADRIIIIGDHPDDQFSNGPVGQSAVRAALAWAKNKIGISA